MCVCVGGTLRKSFISVSALGSVPHVEFFKEASIFLVSLPVACSEKGRLLFLETTLGICVYSWLGKRQ